MRVRNSNIFLIALTSATIAFGVMACNGGTQPTNAIKNSTAISPTILLPADPNPTSGATTVGFTNGQSITYSFYVVNKYGDTVYTMALNQIADSGSHAFTIPADTLVPGTYLYSLRTGNTALSRIFVVN